MAFWSTTDKNDMLEPVRTFRFKFHESEDWWWAKSVSKPTFEISSEEYTLINHTYKFPGTTKWQDVTIKIIDYVKGGRSSEVWKIYDFLKQAGYNPEGRGEDGMSKAKMQRTYMIYQLDADGNILERWTLYNAFIKNVEFSELSYDSDDISDIKITVAYDREILE